MSWEDIIKRRKISDNERNIDPKSFREYGMSPSYEEPTSARDDYSTRSPELQTGAHTYQQGIEKIGRLFMKGKIDSKRYEQLRDELREIFGMDD
jgi:hypothetical protein|tara:strand:- start:1390 stop:1671 length:282 start_codon:yes stop_codon:yes gene_type:complete